MDYQNGKIYKITNCIDDEVYIGSTCQPLTKRFSWHKYRINIERYQNIKVYKHINDLGFDKFSISLVENYPCTNKTELRRREGEFIKEQGTLNDRIAGRTTKEYFEDNKEQIAEFKQKWNKNNKEKTKEYMKEYRKDNKEKLAEKKKEYYENNKEKILEYYENNKEKIAIRVKEYTKKYRENNKEKIKNQKSTKVECEVCNQIVSYTNLSTHKKSKKCLAVSVGNKTDDSKSQA
jgi:hypothetical protein